MRRRAQINEASPGGNGQVVMGDLLKHFMYDGLGRLVRTQTPVTPGSANLRTERFYYDGIRRIQEFVTNPVVTLGGAGGDPVLETLAAESVATGANPDQQTAPAPYEQSQLTLGGGGAVSGTVQREYVWGPGDSGSGGGFDELLVQYDRDGEEAWAIQDAGGDLAAMCDLNGDDGGGNAGYARVVGQWTYDAYGEVLTAEYLQSFASPHLGHKGLFLARLDGTTGSPRLVPFGHALYHMRNRTYAPGLGRFLQRDPNATALALVDATAMHGRGLGALTLVFDLKGLYGDGGNLYAYLGSNPWVRSDSLGLSYDPFDMVDDYLVEDASSKAAFLAGVYVGMETTAFIAGQILQLHPAIGAAVGAYNIATGSGTIWDVLAIAGAGGARAAALIGRSVSSYYKARRLMRAARAAGEFGDEILELHHVVPQFMGAWRRGRVVVLTADQHGQYHTILDNLLRNADNMPRSNSGRDFWIDWLNANPGRMPEIKGILFESVEQFRRQTGIDMTLDLFIELRRQGWLWRR